MIGKALMDNRKYQAEDFAKIAHDPCLRSRLAQQLNDIRYDVEKRAAAKKNNHGNSYNDAIINAAGAALGSPVDREDVWISDTDKYNNLPPDDKLSYNKKRVEIVDKALQYMAGDPATYDDRVVEGVSKQHDRFLDFKNLAQKWYNEGSFDKMNISGKQETGNTKDSKQKVNKTNDGDKANNRKNKDDRPPRVTYRTPDIVTKAIEHPYITGGIAVGTVGAGIGAYLLYKRKKKKELDAIYANKTAASLNHADTSTNGLMNVQNDTVENNPQVTFREVLLNRAKNEDEETRYDIASIKPGERVYMPTIMPNN